MVCSYNNSNTARFMPQIYRPTNPPPPAAARPPPDALPPQQRNPSPAAQAGAIFPGLGYEVVPWYDQFNEFASKNPEGLAQVDIEISKCVVHKNWGFRACPLSQLF